MKKPKHLAIISSGATAIYLLKHVLNHVQILRHEIGSVSIFEKSQITGVGMPYSPQTTDRFNMSNISSEELPELQETFVDWLRAQDDSTLAEHGIVRDEISATDVYDRLALGKYLNAQYRAITEALSKNGIPLHEHSGCNVIDLVDDEDAVHAVTSCLGTMRYDMIFIATGHRWDGEDLPGQGFCSKKGKSAWMKRPPTTARRWSKSNQRMMSESTLIRCLSTAADSARSKSKIIHSAALSKTGGYPAPAQDLLMLRPQKNRSDQRCRNICSPRTASPTRAFTTLPFPIRRVSALIHMAYRFATPLVPCSCKLGWTP